MKLGPPEQVAALLEIGRTLSSTVELERALVTVLEHLEERCGVVRGAVMLVDETKEAQGEIYIVASLGLDAAGRRTRYRLGEGITGRVVESGKSIVVPQISREPLFLHRALRRRARDAEELSFVCVPILVDDHPLGALGVDLSFERDRDYQALLHFLEVVAAMMAQLLRVHRLAEQERQQLVSENTNLKSKLKERYDFSNILGNTGAMREACEHIAQVARTNTTVLIRGESGTGKELIANAIHYNSLRATKPFVKVSCAALPDTLIESELFGYEKGAFTGAHDRKQGRFELAEGGTLFLDEIGDVNPSTQVKLLRVLQEREFERLGGTESIKANVRLIAATNKDLEAAIADRSFREDLFYRLNVFTIFVPPLRERPSDIMLLADHFLVKYAKAHGKSIKRIATAAIDMLARYHWPGNVRELENTIERAVLVCDGQVIHGHHLPPTLQTAEASGTVTQVPLKEAVEQYEKDLLCDALKSSRGNRAQAARLLSSTERIVSYKISKYRIDCEHFKG